MKCIWWWKVPRHSRHMAREEMFRVGLSLLASAGWPWTLLAFSHPNAASHIWWDWASLDYPHRTGSRLWEGLDRQCSGGPSAHHQGPYALLLPHCLHAPLFKHLSPTCMFSHHPFSVAFTTCTLFHWQPLPVYADGSAVAIATRNATSVITYMIFLSGSWPLRTQVQRVGRGDEWAGMSSSGTHQKSGLWKLPNSWYADTNPAPKSEWNILNHS